MARGGAREGAGRKPGIRNKNTQETLAALAETGEMPKDYMLRVMRDPTVDNDRRDRMASAVAPYIHSRMNTTTVTGEGGGPIVVMWKPTQADA